jgi:DNA-binding NarL/FixJ family response regulator
MSVRILIADDQALVRAGFKMILDAEDDLEVVGEAFDGLQAVDMCRRLKPDVVLMDIRMPELDGIEATRRVVSAAGDDSPVRVLMLTTFDLNEYVYEALRAGASGFLLKDVPPEQLAAGIRVVAGGEALLAPSITKRLIQEFAEVAPAMPVPPQGMDELTARELEVFKLVARGLSNAEIAAG